MRKMLRILNTLVFLMFLFPFSAVVYAAKNTDVRADNIKHAAENGNIKAQSALGLMYYNGDHVTQDSVKARYWYEKAAYAGDAYAQGLLGIIYYYGKGTKQDYTRAREWFEKAAQQNDKKAQLALGLIYAKGHGVPENRSAANTWFRKSCDNGLQAACDRVMK